MVDVIVLRDMVNLSLSFTHEIDAYKAAPKGDFQ